MKQDYTIRFITTDDAAAALAVYAPYVLNTAISFEYEVPPVDDFRNKIEKIIAQYPWLVCTCNDEIIGYAYGSTHRNRKGYQWSPEVTVYMKEDHHRKGIARLLYSALFDMLRMQGYYSVYAGVLSTNIKSVPFHKAMGFEEIGVFRNIGYKLGEWHSNLWLQYSLQDHLLEEPATPVSIDKLMDTDAFKELIAEANRGLLI
ncbi:MAG: hypothetical protein BGO70_12960 [Bacteroidetes bacterium 43-93]|nr:N-acetyltransferase [Bacteroidota bacterium]OJW99349.1 MAG: hypothetical protein BGO70_12960 [Bacteroidetes bacterium 43-93]